MGLRDLEYDAVYVDSRHQHFRAVSRPPPLGKALPTSKNVSTQKGDSTILHNVDKALPNCTESRYKNTT